MKTLGDGVMASFTSCLGAVACGVAMQRAVAAHNANHPDRRIAIRVGVDASEPFQDESDPVTVANLSGCATRPRVGRSSSPR